MAGIEPVLDAVSELHEGMQRAVHRALHDADLILWLVNGREGVHPLDSQVARVLRGLGVPVMVVANFCDDAAHELGSYEFAQFGFEDIFPVSAVHARGTGVLMEAVTSALKKIEAPAPTQYETNELVLALVGRPNVGKSTLLNALLNDERAVVSAVPGTTRDAVDEVIDARDFFDVQQPVVETVRIVDTAGIRRKGKIGTHIESWSIIRTESTIRRAQVVLLMFDTVEGMVHQDLVVAQHANEAGSAVIIVANKWDAVLAAKGIIPGTKEDLAHQEFVQHQVLNTAPFLGWAPLIFVSGQEKIHLTYLKRLIQKAYTAWSAPIVEEDVKALALDLMKHPNIRRMTALRYAHSQPPTFKAFFKGKDEVHFSEVRMIENRLREAMGEFAIATPIRIEVITGGRG